MRKHERKSPESGRSSTVFLFSIAIFKLYLIERFIENSLGVNLDFWNMQRFIVTAIVFIIYLILLFPPKKGGIQSSLRKINNGFFYWAIGFTLLFGLALLTNFIFFGDIFSPMEEKLVWIPILRAPLLEEGTKLVSVYLIKRKEKVVGNELIRYGGLVGNWFFLAENFLYISANDFTFSFALIRLFPWQIVYTMLDALGIGDVFQKERIMFPVLAFTLHGLTNYMAIYLQAMDYVLYSAILSLPLFIIFLTKFREKKKSSC